MLIECLIYIVVLAVLLGVAYMAFYRCVDSSVGLNRSADDIINALHAGERWRADLRAATGDVQVESDANGATLVIPTARGKVTYQSTTNAVLRRVGSAGWTTLLERVKTSTMKSDPRENVTAWQWEFELQPRSKKPVKVRPLFTFIGVPPRATIP